MGPGGGIIDRVSRERKCVIMPRKSTKTEVKATETAIESKVEDIKTEDKATETKVAEETTTGRKTSGKKADSKTESKAAPKKAAKEAGEKATKADGKETGAKASKSTAKKAETKCSVQIQYAGKACTLEDLEKTVRDIWKEDLKQKAGDLQNIELYVKPEENKVYYVMNGEHRGSFDI